MRYRDQPTVQVEERIVGDPSAIWDAVTDIELPIGISAELQAVEWLDGATEVAVGNHFRGRNVNANLGEWSTESTIVEVEPGTRWVWQVGNGDEVMATWGFEVDPGKDAVTVRQWARLGPDPSGVSLFIERFPNKEARIISRRLDEWRAGMAANLDALKERIERNG